MAQVRFLGANQEVTGSSSLLIDGDDQFLIDCGLLQGNRYAEQKNHDDFAFDPRQIQAVFVTHGHMDHIGRLPKLVKEGYRGPIYATAATQDFAEILFADAVEIMQEDAERGGPAPIYDPEDIPRTMAQFRPLDYHESIQLSGGWKGKLWDAGHILGSASVDLAGPMERIVFSGDLGNAPVPILQKTESPDGASLVIMESTYGDRQHEDPATRESLLRAAISETMQAGGVLLIPSFALERTQELLYYFNTLHQAGAIPSVPVFLDSPMAIHATHVFERHQDLWSADARSEFAAHDFFNFSNLKMTATRDESRAINAVPAPKIIIAGSGMMNGGRILHHAKRYLTDPASMLLFIGYQAEGTLGRALLSGRKRVHIHGEEVFVRAKIRAIGAFSAHADQPHLLNWLRGFAHRPGLVALNHGELDRMKGLAAAVEDQLHLRTIIPQFGEVLEVPHNQS